MRRTGTTRSTTCKCPQADDGRRLLPAGHVGLLSPHDPQVASLQGQRAEDPSGDGVLVARHVRDNEHGPIRPMDDPARDRAEQRAGDGAEPPRSDDDHGRVPGLRELDDPVPRVALEDLGVSFASFLADKRLRAVDGGPRVCHLLGQLLLVVRLPQQADRGPGVDEHRTRPEHPRHPGADDHRPLGRLGAVRGDDHRFGRASVWCHGGDGNPPRAPASSPGYAVARTTITGQVDRTATDEETLPSTDAARAPRPRDPMTIRSARCASAASTIAPAGSPRREIQSGLVPRRASSTGCSSADDVGSSTALTVTSRSWLARRSETSAAFRSAARAPSLSSTAQMIGPSPTGDADSGTISVGHGPRAARDRDTLPRRSEPTDPRPRDPTTTSSASASSAVAPMTSAAPPIRTSRAISAPSPSSATISSRRVTPACCSWSTVTKLAGSATPSSRDARGSGTAYTSTSCAPSRPDRPLATAAAVRAPGEWSTPQTMVPGDEVTLPRSSPAGRREPSSAPGGRLAR